MQTANGGHSGPPNGSGVVTPVDEPRGAKRLILAVSEEEIDIMLATLTFMCKHGQPSERVHNIAAELSKYLHEQNMKQIISKGSIH